MVLAKNKRTLNMYIYIYKHMVHIIVSSCSEPAMLPVLDRVLAIITHADSIVIIYS